MQFQLKHLLLSFFLIAPLLVVASAEGIEGTMLFVVPFVIGGVVGAPVAEHPRGAVSGAIFGGLSVFALLGLALVLPESTTRIFGLFVPFGDLILLVAAAVVGGFLGGCYCRYFISGGM